MPNLERREMLGLRCVGLPLEVSEDGQLRGLDKANGDVRGRAGVFGGRVSIRCREVSEGQ